MANPAKVILAGCLLLALSMQMCSVSGSAIPIWEFLTRNEKMSYLYSTFAQLVSVHCKATATSATLPVNQCKRNLLSYGYEKLQTFSEAQLEALDPYQHGANELIWSSIMRDHASATSLVTTRKPLPTPPASSLIILTHQQQQPSSVSRAQYPRNPLFESSASAGHPMHSYAMDMDTAYGYGAGNVNDPKSPTRASSTEQQSFLTGPLVFRVRPDGTPVDEDKFTPLPRDEDLEVFQVTSSNQGGNSDVSASGRPNKHRKIATINALKQQHFASAALTRDLQPPHVEQRRVFRQVSSVGPNPGYFYGKPQA